MLRRTRGRMPSPDGRVGDAQPGAGTQKPGGVLRTGGESAGRGSHTPLSTGPAGFPVKTHPWFAEPPPCPRPPLLAPGRAVGDGTTVLPSSAGGRGVRRYRESRGICQPVIRRVLTCADPEKHQVRAVIDGPPGAGDDHSEGRPHGTRESPAQDPCDPGAGPAAGWPEPGGYAEVLPGRPVADGWGSGGGKVRGNGGWVGGGLLRVGGSAGRRVGGSAGRRVGGSAARRLGGSAARRLGGSAARRLRGRSASWRVGAASRRRAQRTRAHARARAHRIEGAALSPTAPHRTQSVPARPSAAPSAAGAPASGPAVPARRSGGRSTRR